MTEITKLNITELDFDVIKNNLKDYFKSQTEFTDHDFDGSAISVLLDILSYNTHYNSYYMNMLASESFLDSAQLRDSVVSKASMLGYTPKSARGATANVEITITPNDSPASITVDKDTQLLSVQFSKVGQKSYDAFPNLKWIVVRQHGFDNVNLDECETRGIGVVNTKPFAKPTADWISDKLKPHDKVMFIGYGEIATKVNNPEIRSSIIGILYPM